jgi:hypothetical protein
VAAFTVSSLGAFAIRILQAEEILEVGVAENEIGCKPVGVVEPGKIVPNGGSGMREIPVRSKSMLRTRIAKRPDTSTFQPAHLSIELSDQLIFEV